MKFNWNSLIPVGITILIVAVLFFNYKRHIAKDVYIKNKEIENDSLYQNIYMLNNQIYNLKQEEQIRDKILYNKVSEIKRLKDEYQKEKNKADIPIIILNDSVRTTIITEYFIEQGVSLHYSRSKR